MATVNDHVDELKRIVHDPDQQYWSDSFMVNAVNRAIKQRDQSTGGNRTLLPFTLTAGDGTYSFSDVGNTRVFDVVGISVLFNGQRVVLNQISYTDLVASPRYQAWTTYRDVPRAFARYGANSVVLAPLPSQAYETEWDCCIVSADLTGSDSDPLPYPYTEPVPWFAAYLCKSNMRAWQEAETCKEEFYRLCSLIEGARVGLLPSAYTSRAR